MSHRDPPDPPHWDSEPGICRWCGCCIVGPTGKPMYRLRWHEKCLAEYKVIFWPQETRYQLWSLGGGACEVCGCLLAWSDIMWSRTTPGGWRERYQVIPKPEAHHIIPLHRYPHDRSDPYRAWRMPNLMLLCHDCHVKQEHFLKRGADELANNTDKNELA